MVTLFIAKQSIVYETRDKAFTRYCLKNTQQERIVLSRISWEKSLYTSLPIKFHNYNKKYEKV